MKYNFALALEALKELSQELEESNPEPAAGFPRLEEMLNGLGALPPGALLLGMADDGLPVLLNLHDPIPGPLLVTGEGGNNRTEFLKFLVQVIEATHDPNAVQFGILSPAPQDWGGYEGSASCAGIVPIYTEKGRDFILSLNAWAHSNKTRQVVVLLVDGLEYVRDWDQNSSDTLRWLLMRGPARRVWPIVTAGESGAEQVPYLMEQFRTRIHSQIPQEAGRRIFPLESADSPETCSLFMKEGSQWLRFWFPKP
jgi:hypothetical protein